MAFLRLNLVAAVFLLPLALAVTDRGVVYLDDLTFSKVVDGSRDVLVRFDKEYAWGDDHDAFKEAAKKISASDGVLTASVPVSKRDYEPQNAELADKYGVGDESSFPAYRLFRKGHAADAPLAYPAGASKKAEALLAWVAQHTGAFFGLKGQVKELDTIARKFMAAGDAVARSALAREAAAFEAAEEGQVEAAKYYAKVMTKALEKPEWPAAEAKRLPKLLLGKISDEARAALELKINVLASFVGGSGAAGIKQAEADARAAGEL